MIWNLKYGTFLKIIDLTIHSRHKVEAEIKHYCGGKSFDKYWFSTFQKGLGGFSFTDKHGDGVEEKFMVSVAIFTAGLGVYCRNMRNNYLVLIPESTIKRMEIIKQKDTIKPYRFSFYSILKKVGLSDHTASRYLMPKEIIKEHKPALIIRTHDTFFSLEINKISPLRVVSLIKKTKFAEITDIRIETPEIKK